MSERICEICNNRYDVTDIEKINNVSVQMGETDLYDNVPLGKVSITCKQGLIKYLNICPSCLKKILEQCTEKINKIIDNAKVCSKYDKTPALNSIASATMILEKNKPSMDGSDILTENTWIAVSLYEEIQTFCKMLTDIIDVSLSDYEFMALANVISDIEKNLNILVADAILSATNGTMEAESIPTDKTDEDCFDNPEPWNVE